MLILQKHCSTRCLSTKFFEIIYTEPIVVASFLTPGLPDKQEALAAGWGGPATVLRRTMCKSQEVSAAISLEKDVAYCVLVWGSHWGNMWTHAYNTQTTPHIHHIHVTHDAYTIRGHIPHRHIHQSCTISNTLYHTTCTYYTSHTLHTHHKQHTNSTQKAYTHIYTDTHTTHHTQSHANTTHCTQRHTTRTHYVHTTHPANTHTILTPRLFSESFCPPFLSPLLS